MLVEVLVEVLFMVVVAIRFIKQACFVGPADCAWSSLCATNLSEGDGTTFTTTDGKITTVIGDQVSTGVEGDGSVLRASILLLIRK